MLNRKYDNQALLPMCVPTVCLMSPHMADLPVLPLPYLYTASNHSLDDWRCQWPEKEANLLHLSF